MSEYNQSPDKDSPPDEDVYLFHIELDPSVDWKLRHRRGITADVVNEACCINAQDDHVWNYDDKEHSGWRLYVEAKAFAYRKGGGKDIRVILVPERWTDPNDGYWYCVSANWADD